MLSVKTIWHELLFKQTYLEEKNTILTFAIFAQLFDTIQVTVNTTNFPFLLDFHLLHFKMIILYELGQRKMFVIKFFKSSF